MSTLAPTSFSASMAVPQTQNSAPVLEYQCLFTRDLRQKQKRWQDGRLKYHTFNKRVMVYDERSNNVGDTHWREDFELGDGEELQLDRGGILVQVGECIGNKDQDLSDLMGKRVKAKEDRLAARIAAAGSSPAPAASRLHRPQGFATPASSSSRIRPLNTIIGTPPKHYGRAAISTASPFEERQMLASSDQGVPHPEERPAKRHKHLTVPPSKSGYAQNLFGTAMTLSRPTSSASSGTMKSFDKRSLISMIDLTVDDTKEKREILAEKKGSENAVSSGQAKERLPSSKSTYAGNLIGAALSLSNQRVISASHPHKRIKPADRSVNRTTAVQESALPSNTEGSTDEPANPNIRIAESSPRSKHKTDAISRTFQILSPSALVSSTSEPSAPREIDSSSVSKTSTLGPTLLPTHGPRSALRIKARKPKQMMMLMQPPPSSKSSSRRLSSLGLPYGRQPSSASTILNPAVSAMDTISLVQDEEELSEGTLSMDFGLQQNEHTGSSPPLDSGIDYQTIDALLNRNRSARTQPANDLGHASLISTDLETSFESSAQFEGSTKSRIEFLETSGKGCGNGADTILSEIAIADHDTLEESFDCRTGPSVQDDHYSTVAGYKVVQSKMIQDLFKHDTNIDKNQSRAHDGNNGDEDCESENYSNAEIAGVVESSTDLEVLISDREEAQMKNKEDQEKLDLLRSERGVVQRRIEERLETARRVTLKGAKDIAQTPARKEQQDQEKLWQEKELAHKEIEDARQEVARQARLEEERRLDEIRQEVALLQQQKEQEVADQRRRLEAARKAEEETERLARLEKEREIAVSQARAEEEKKLAELRSELERLRQEKEAESERQRLEEQKVLAGKQRAQERNAREKQCEEDVQQEEKEVEEPLLRKKPAHASTERVVNQTEVFANSLSKATGIALPSKTVTAVQSATDRFRHMIQLPTQQSSTGNPSRTFGVAADALSRVPTVSEAAETDNSYKSPLLGIQSNGRVLSVSSSKDVPESSNCLGASMTSGVTKAFKLSRPIRIENTAKAPETMPPPGRAGKISEVNSSRTSDQWITSRKATSDGPWSQEAFDLFAWRPPP